MRPHAHSNNLRTGTFGVLLAAWAAWAEPAAAQASRSNGLQERIAEAQARYRREDYAGALNRLSGVSVAGAKPSAQAEYHWLTGRCFDALSSPTEALSAYEAFLAVAPDDSRAAGIQSRVASLRATLVERFPDPGQLQQRIAKLKAVYAANPENLQAQTELADALWRAGRYPEAAGHYQVLLESGQQETGLGPIAFRLEQQPDGSYVALTPNELERRQAIRQPLLIRNTRSFRSDPDRRTRVPRTFVVAGEVLHRGLETLDAVEVQVTILAFGRGIYDTGSARIGTMRPGESRAFSLRFRNFDNIDNIDDYECTVTFLSR